MSAMRMQWGDAVSPLRPQSADIHAFQALAELEVYEACVDRFVTGFRDGDTRRSLGEHLATLRRCCAGYPGLSVPWLALMISHFELLGGLAEPTLEAQQPDATTPAMRRHQGCVRELACACRRELLHHALPATARSIARGRRAAKFSLHEGERA